MRAESRLVGRPPGDAIALAGRPRSPPTSSEAVEDANGSAEYKQQLVRVLVERCFRAATG